jgi:hypothetical protein
VLPAVMGELLLALIVGVGTFQLITTTPLPETSVLPCPFTELVSVAIEL